MWAEMWFHGDPLSGMGSSPAPCRPGERGEGGERAALGFAVQGRNLAKERNGRGGGARPPHPQHREETGPIASVNSALSAIRAAIRAAPLAANGGARRALAVQHCTMWLVRNIGLKALPVSLLLAGVFYLLSQPGHSGIGQHLLDCKGVAQVRMETWADRVSRNHRGLWPNQPSLSMPQNERIVKLHTGQGGLGTLTAARIQELRNQEYHDVYDDLLLFTGLSEHSLNQRLMRTAHFHFEAEHNWWNPQSQDELTWYYRSSVSYLFANAVHPQEKHIIDALKRSDGPVLEYSGGTGTNALALAKKGIQVHYFGIGLQEYAFARFRAARHNLTDMITFVEPFTNVDGRLQFHSFLSVPNATYGAILAMDVLEHIPNYHVTLRHLLGTLRSGGRIFESSPFDNSKSNTDPAAIHQQQSMSMNEAMVGMHSLPAVNHINVWIKV